MDQDQSADSQNAQACMPAPLVSTAAPAPADVPQMCVAPAPASGDASNPLLTSTAPAENASGEPKSDSEPSPLVEKSTTAAGLTHVAADVPEALETTTKATETAESTVKLTEAWNSPAGLSGGANLPIDPAVKAAAGGSPNLAQSAEAAQTAAAEGKLTFGNAIAPLALGLDIYKAGNDIKDMEKNGANLENAPDLVQASMGAVSSGIGTVGLMGTGATAAGLTGTGAALTSVAATLAPVGMVAGAAAGGLELGHLMGEAADSKYTKDANGQTAMDKGASWGTYVDSHFGDKDPSHPSIAGGIAAAAGGITMGTFGALQAAGSWLGQKLGPNTEPPAPAPAPAPAPLPVVNRDDAYLPGRIPTSDSP